MKEKFRCNLPHGFLLFVRECSQTYGLDVWSYILLLVTFWGERKNIFVPLLNYFCKDLLGLCLWIVKFCAFCDHACFLEFYCSMACVRWYPEVRCFCVAMSVVAFMVFLWEDLVFGFLARPWPYHCTSRLAALSTWWRQVLLQQWWERWLPNPFT